MWLLQVARNFTQDEDKSLDLVQELYLYLMQMKDIEKIRYNNTVNLFYLYKVIKSKFLNGIKQDKKMIVLPVEEDYLEIGEEEYSLDRDERTEFTPEGYDFYEERRFFSNWIFSLCFGIGGQKKYLISTIEIIRI